MYRERIQEKTLKRYLGIFKAVSVVGPKYSGKTTLAERFAKSSLYVNARNLEENKTLFHLNPEVFFEGETPKLIDEWQLIPAIWDDVRSIVDTREGRGHFILTGSSAANYDDTTHSGAGRIGSLVLRPMSLYESAVSSGKVSLSELFDGLGCGVKKSNVTVKDYATWIIKGGWPEGIDDSEEYAITKMDGYLDALLRQDINKVSGKKFNEVRARKILESLARYTATEATNKSIQRDLETLETTTATNTLIDYLEALQKLYILEDLKPWNPNLRSKTVIRSATARFFVDPSIAAAALNVNSSKLMKDFNTFGAFFECMAIRDIRTYSESISGKVYRYKDKTGLEIDTIVQLQDGRWGAIEVKMGSHLFDDAAEKLKNFASKVDIEKMGKPSFLAIVSATENAYQREDGVFIIPLGLLKN